MKYIIEVPDDMEYALLTGGVRGGYYSLEIEFAKLEKAEPRWIPVTERLPEESGCYLVSVKNDHERRYSKTAWFEKDVWFARQDVIAWMPLPEPFKGVTE